MQLKAGTLLQGGKYEIIRILGQGGFGITYLARQVFLKREVALKEFFMKDCCERDPETSRITVGTGTQGQLVEKFRGKFIREAQMIAGMKHPHIVSVLDVFEENGTAYYVMENLPGGSLADKVKREGPLSEAQAEKYIRQVASALNYIHLRNTVHLDVKPSNILLDEDGGAVLIDFGISKHYDKAGDQTSSTPVGISRGYAPLEQGRDGDVSQFTPATDIYALGATLYNLVSGRVPEEASIVAENGLDRPEGISDRLWNAIEHAMRPFRKNRPQSISEFLILLDAKEEKVAAAPEKAVVKPEVRPAVEETKSEETVVEEKAAQPMLEPKQDTSSVSDVKHKTELKPWVWGLVFGSVVALVMLFVIIGKTSSAPTASTVVSSPKRESSPSGNINGHGYVDLGLSVKWASCNLGASSPEEYGDYYAWGETETKTNYEWSTYKWCKGDYNKLTKYCPSDESGYWAGYGSPDGKTRLDLSDDVAHIKLGGKWRIPTDEEWTELRERCKWTWTSTNSVNGYTVTGPSGNSIFLPAAGYRYGTLLYDAGSYGLYWSSSLNRGSPDYAWRVRFYSGNDYRYYGRRYYGHSVRPVTE